MKKMIIFFLVTLATVLHAQQSKTAAFHVVPLGVKGGVEENNLSAYMVAPAGTNDYICFDAGTVYAAPSGAEFLR